MGKLFHLDIVVSTDVIDENNHVNNVAYVKWMQDVAVSHSRSTGGTQAARDAGGTWVARAHYIEYRQPAFQGNRLRLMTWISDFRKIRSQRRYKFLRLDDNVTIAVGYTDWVFVDAVTGRPRSIPPTVVACFDILPESEEP
ncbi:MAG: acyl-CoA thioesterase [Thainema sp.]